MNNIRLMARFVFFAVIVVFCVSYPVVVIGAGLSDPQGNLVMDDFGYSEYRFGSKRWTVSARNAIHDFDGNVARIDNLFMRLFTDSSSPGVTLQAESGILKFDDRRVELSGAVKISDPRGYRFSTEQLSYNDKAQVAQGEGAIFVESDAIKISGDGFEYATMTGIFRIHQDVEAQMNLPRK